MTPAREDGQRTLAATYRLQLRPEFTFGDAARAVPYLASLGASHLYLSPIWECVPGSLHGYDVIDHGAVRREIGGMAGLLRLHAAAAAAGLELIADIVPNHVSVARALHPWWRDVLRYGQASEFATFFDIDWQGHTELPAGVLVLPVLGRPFGEALEAGEIGLAWDGEDLVATYGAASFPLAPESYQRVPGMPPQALASSLDDPSAYASFAGLIEELSGAGDAGSRQARGRFARLLAAEPALRAWVEERLAALVGTPDDPHSWDGLDDLLSRQHYRLAYWRVSGEQVNYRRFFDINELAAIRQEHPPTFDATHALAASLINDGVLGGVRVDHIDGLYDPAAYLRRVSEAANASRPLLWVEKILAPGEELPGDWTTDGTTGYDFLAMAGSLFIDRAGERSLERAWMAFGGAGEPFEQIAAAARFEAAERSFSGEVGVLAAQLHRLAQRDRRYRDVTLTAFRGAIEAVLAAFPVYRTYFEHAEPRAVDREIVARATGHGRAMSPRVPAQAFDFLARVLLLDSDRLGEQERPRWVHFRRRFQQMSAPIMAKGVEDTAFFRYVRLLALCEVGDDPGRFGASVEAFHAWAVERARRWPRALSATSTHDTKRSEDARMRLAVLSELADEWHREALSWARLNARHRSGPWPDGPAEYYLYQSLVASFTGTVDAGYIDRIAAHMLKAAREAKVHTSWLDPDASYEAALDAFVRAILDARTGRAFRRRLGRWVARLEPAAQVNSLALTALKCLGPGVPDVYQGAEFPLYTLTDPDNRHPVDFTAAADRLAHLPASAPTHFAAAKPWLLRALLRLRREHGAAFSGGYRPVDITGAAAGHAVAFERYGGETHVIAVVPRLVAPFVDGDGHLALPPLSIEFAGGLRWHNALTGDSIEAGVCDVSPHLSHFPVAVFVGEQP